MPCPGSKPFPSPFPDPSPVDSRYVLVLDTLLLSHLLHITIASESGTAARIDATMALSSAFLVQWLERFTSSSRVLYEEVTRSIRVEGRRSLRRGCFLFERTARDNRCSELGWSGGR